jgi:hypothetical protein
LPFIQYAANGLIGGLREQIERIREQQFSVAWENYVYEKFRNRSSGVQKRRRDLLLALSDQNAWTKISDILTLSPALAVAYKETSRFTLRNDLVALQKMGLIELDRDSAKPRMEIMLAFLPWRREDEPPVEPSDT